MKNRERCTSASVWFARAGSRGIRVAWVFAAIAVVVAVGRQGAWSATTRQPPAGPAIAVDEPTHDFGVVWATTPPRTLEHTFKISNVGTEPLKFISVKPGRGRTLPGAHPKVLAPGETGDFPFKLHSQTLHGPFRNYINVTTNDPKTPITRLALTGQLKHCIEVTPSRAYFGRVYARKQEERILKVKNNTDKPLELVLTTQPANVPLDIELKEKEAGQQYELHVRTKPPYEPGTTTSVMAILKTNIEQEKEVRVQVFLQSTARLDIVPDQLVIQAPRPGARPSPRGLTRTVQIINHGEVPVMILDASVDDPKIRLTWRESMARKRHYLSLNFPWDYMPPAAGRTLTIKTDDVDKPTIKVPIRAYRPSTADRPQRPAATMLNKPAPSFSLKTMRGEVVSDKEFGKYVATVLNFVVPNCGYCSMKIIAPAHDVFLSGLADRNVYAVVL